MAGDALACERITEPEPFVIAHMGLLGLPGRGLSSFAQRINVKPQLLRIALGALIYLSVAVLALSSISARDPGSVFFRPTTAYQRQYSLAREEQAEKYVDRASIENGINSGSHIPSQEKQLCIGIPSVARDGTRYLRSTVGSLLEGLSQEERNNVHVVVLIAHSDPLKNPAYQEAWLANSVDHVLLYKPGQLEDVIAMEKDVGNREKMLYDYTYALQACINAGTPYIAMLEDDVLASDGWFWRTLLGLQQVDEILARSADLKDYLYIRLFYTEEFLGWNSEYWLVYLSWSLMFAVIIVGSVFVARGYSTTAKKVISAPLLMLAMAIVLPSSVLLFFAAGKMTVLPMPHGVNAMNQYGCCSQGLVFPRAKAQDIVGLFEERKIGFVDMLIEEYADKHDEFRWALTPPVLQHIGRKSSKGDDFGEASKNDMPVAAKLWNFQYELNDVEELRWQHDIVLAGVRNSETVG